MKRLNPSEFNLNSNLVVLAHELKSPLALMRQMALFIDQGNLDPQKNHRYLQQIVATGERGLRLVSDLTRVANIDQLQLNFEPINVLELCHQVKLELDPLYKLHHKNLVVHRKRRQYLAVADSYLLKSILIHFCDNALHYADQTHPVKLEVSQTRQTIRISIKDHGPRLATYLWRQLKKRQLLTPQTISSRPQSSGLGLCIAQQFAEMMSAQLGVCSHNDGVSFYVDLVASSQLSLL